MYYNNLKIKYNIVNIKNQLNRWNLFKLQNIK